MRYAEKMKQWIRDNKSLDATVRLLYNSVWGECSRLTKNKLMMVTYFYKFETERDITKLIKEIRRVSLCNMSIHNTLGKAKFILYIHTGREQVKCKLFKN